MKGIQILSKSLYHFELRIKKTPSVLKICICIVCVSLNIHAQELNKKIDGVMQKYVELDLFSGTVLLAKEGKVVYAKAFGDANKSYQIKNNIDTKFNICSMGKMFTGVSILQLEEREKLKLNDPVSKHLIDFPLGDKITIHHLLSHTSGVGNYMRHPVYRSKRSEMRTINDLLPFIYEQKLDFKIPGKRFSYSNSGMILLGAIIEKITGQSYSDYITKNIFSPAKMNDTQMKFWDDVVKNRSIGYMKSLSGKYQNNVYKSSAPQSDGGILSTVGDMLKFDQALYSSILINEASKQKLFTAVMPKVTYGLAFQVEDRHKNKVVGHSGGAPGFSSYFSRYLKDKYTIIALSNYDMISKNVVHYIEDILYKVEYKLPRPRLNQFIYNNMNKISALGSLEKMTDFIGTYYTIRSPQHLNMIAYEFIHEDEKDFAIELFKLNVHLFPNVANGYDSLGEAYEKNKQYDLALKNYEKAVEVAKKNADLSLNSFTQTLQRFKKEYHK
ncbi:serine hydrolase [Aquimarina macrocephali]|uniref:serine hydrolase n=1 Tax=Aquimarina macrocephali TaxID=666563 RepID=UPI0004638B5C|nr:serine hydrolase [Aquimarina macrocephali]